MSYSVKIASAINARPNQVESAIRLIDDGNTVPFIARYRKEATGGLDDTQLRDLSAMLEKLRAIDERRETIIASIEEQEAMTDELRAKITQAETLTELEDLYEPYKQKRRTRATIAREKGLEGLADLILQQVRTQQSLELIARPFLNDEVFTIEDAYQGARDIVAEIISEDADIRGEVRGKAFSWGVLQAKKTKTDDPKDMYEIYYDFQNRVDRVQAYQVLAINRGEAEKILRVKVDIAERDWRRPIETRYRTDRRSPLAEQLELAIDDSAKRLLLPAIERDVRRELTENAEAQAIRVFADNLRGLLNQPPLLGKAILGIDPGFRTGCKVAVIDETGKVLDTATIYPHPPQKRADEALQALEKLIARYQVQLIAIGNGTASRETEQLIAQLTRNRDDVHYLIVSEAGASIYSASEIASKELPDMDVSLRGAVSIARRVQDPLAELVKIDARSIGVGMYQHDVNQSNLTSALDGVVESVVNQVGVDVNTASPALLTHVAGIGATLAKRIVDYREEQGAYTTREAIKEVKGIGAKAFEQCAGFLRVRDGENPLDASAIHPESYAIAEALMKQAALDMQMPPEEREQTLQPLKQNINELTQQLDVGKLTLLDILEQLARPGRDPREDMPVPILRSDVLSMEDLEPGMLLKGTARNVVDFGVFVDIGVKQDGLLHRSKIPRGMVISVGDVLDIKILSVEPERGRIGLSLAD